MPRDLNKKVRCPVPDCNDEVNLSSLRRHMKSANHAGAGPRVVCPFVSCGLDFINKPSMKSHFKANHENNKYLCKVCDFVADTAGKLNHHKSVKHDRKYKCPYPDCPLNLSSKKNLISHINALENRGGHGGVYFVEEKGHANTQNTNEEVTSSKRKSEELDPVEAFLESRRKDFKDMDLERICASRFCVLIDLAYGFFGGEKVYCSKHHAEVPGMVNLGKMRLCRYIGCTRWTHTRIGGRLICAGHLDQLIREGLPTPDGSIKKPKDSGKICNEDGCGLHSSFDDGRYCYSHSPTKVSDDKRRCAVLGCENGRPTFGFAGETKTRCKEHKEDNMYSRKLCSTINCFVSANYGPMDGLPLTCVHHKEESFINLNATMCAMACCLYGNGPQAKFFHPDHTNKSSEFFGKRICSFGRRVLIEEALHRNDIDELRRLMNHFKLTEVTTLNAQSAFRFECEKKYHDRLLQCVKVVFDGHVHDGPKTLWSKRPDIFYKFSVDEVNYGIHIEYDEQSNHEDESVRLECIARDAECSGRVYLIRVQGGHGTKNPLCTRMKRDGYKYFVVTHEGSAVASQVSDAVIDRIEWIKEGLGPGDGRPAKIEF